MPPARRRCDSRRRAACSPRRRSDGGRTDPRSRARRPSARNPGAADELRRLRILQIEDLDDDVAEARLTGRGVEVAGLLRPPPLCARMMNLPPQPGPHEFGGVPVISETSEIFEGSVSRG